MSEPLFFLKQTFFDAQEKGDRAYLVEKENGVKEVTLAAKIINGLKQMNTSVTRENQCFDKAFIKALLVGLIGIKEIKTHGVDTAVLNFIKGFYQYLNKLQKRSLIV